MASVLARAARPARQWNSCRLPLRLNAARFQKVAHAVSGNGVAVTLDDLRTPNDNATPGSDFAQPPEWVKILAIALASSLVALIELAVCRSAALISCFVVV